MSDIDSLCLFLPSLALSVRYWQLVCVPSLPSSDQYPVYCEKHEDHCIEYFCLDDNTPICSNCVVMGDHQRHGVTSIEERVRGDALGLQIFKLYYARLVLTHSMILELRSYTYEAILSTFWLQRNSQNNLVLKCIIGRPLRRLNSEVVLCSMWSKDGFPLYNISKRAIIWNHFEECVKDKMSMCINFDNWHLHWQCFHESVINMKFHLLMSSEQKSHARLGQCPGAWQYRIT